MNMMFCVETKWGDVGNYCRCIVVVRYYLAEGVKLYSQETWRMFMGNEGRQMVGKYAEHVADYYCMASELDNHCVRESACHSIAEMAEKVGVVKRRAHHA